MVAQSSHARVCLDVTARPRGRRSTARAMPCPPSVSFAACGSRVRLKRGANTIADIAGKAPVCPPREKKVTSIGSESQGISPLFAFRSISRPAPRRTVSAAHARSEVRQARALPPQRCGIAPNPKQRKCETNPFPFLNLNKTNCAPRRNEAIEGHVRNRRGRPHPGPSGRELPSSAARTAEQITKRTHRELSI